SVNDLFLNPDSFVMPCSTSALTLSYYTNPPRVDGASVVCRVPGTVNTPVHVSVCDYAANCSTQDVTPTPSTGAPTIRIDTPATSVITGTTATPVGGLAYAATGIQQITLTANGSPVATLNYPARPTETSW